MGFKGLLAKIFAVGTLLLGAAKVDAGLIAVQNYTSNTSIGKSSLTEKNVPGASEGEDMYDGSFLPPPQTKALEIYGKNGTDLLGLDAHPIDTTGWDFYLGVKGTNVTCDNSLRFRVTDTTDLTGKIISAYDVTNPDTRYTIPQDGSIYSITLPSLSGQGAGEYAHWRIDLTPVPEPATAILLGLGAAGLAGYHLRRRRETQVA